MRLLVISQYFWPENFRINDLVAGLIARGHEVTVLAGEPNYPDGTVIPDFRRDAAACSRFNGAQIVRVPLVPRGRGRIQLLLNYVSFAVTGCLVGAWRLRGRKFDAIFVCQLSPATLALPGVLQRTLKKIPMAMWVLDLWPESLRAVGAVRSPALLGLIGKLVSFIYDRCDLILAQSRSFIPEIARSTRNVGKIVYFPSWAESVFDMGSEQPAPEVPVQPGSFNVVFAGNMGEAQDFPAVLAAAELLRDDPRVRWLLIGDGRMAAWIREEISRRGLQHRVLMLGKYPVGRMPSFYRHADALLVCLKDEPIFAMTLPGKLQSYLAAGIPVVAMLNGEGADVVERSGSGVTCGAGDAHGLAAAVLKLASMSLEQRAEMGRNARAVSASEFNRDRLISELKARLEQLPEVIP